MLSWRQSKLFICLFRYLCYIYNIIILVVSLRGYNDMYFEFSASIDHDDVGNHTVSWKIFWAISFSHMQYSTKPHRSIIEKYVSIKIMQNQFLK